MKVVVERDGVKRTIRCLDFYMGNCQNYGPFLGPYYNTGPNTGPNLGDPKRDHNFDNPPHDIRLEADIHL